MLRWGRQKNDDFIPIEKSLVFRTNVLVYICVCELSESVRWSDMLVRIEEFLLDITFFTGIKCEKIVPKMLSNGTFYHDFSSSLIKPNYSWILCQSFQLHHDFCILSVNLTTNCVCDSLKPSDLPLSFFSISLSFHRQF